MADPTPTDPKTPDVEEQDDIQTARPHHKDKGTVVKTAFGEKISGGIADITDGDDE